MKKTLAVIAITLLIIGCEKKKEIKLTENIEVSNQLKNNFQVESDKFKGVDFITAKKLNSSIYPYILKTDSTSYVLKISGYKQVDNEYIHDKVIFNVDGKNMDLDLGEFDIIDGSRVVKFDEIVDAETWQILKSISESKKVDVRWNGHKGYADEELKPSEIKAFDQTLRYYESLGGTIN